MFLRSRAKKPDETLTNLSAPKAMLIIESQIVRRTPTVQLFHPGFVTRYKVAVFGTDSAEYIFRLKAKVNYSDCPARPSLVRG